MRRKDQLQGNNMVHIAATSERPQHDGNTQEELGMEKKEPIVIILKDPLSGFKRREAQPQARLSARDRIIMSLTLFFMGGNVAMSTVAAHEGNSWEDKALGLANSENKTSKIVPGRSDSDVGPYGLDLDGMRSDLGDDISADEQDLLNRPKQSSGQSGAEIVGAGPDDEPSQEQNPDAPEIPAGLRPAHYNHEELDPAINALLGFSAESRYGDPLFLLDLAFDENGVLRAPGVDGLSDRDFLDVIAGDGPINEALRTLIDTLSYQGLTSGFRVEFIGQKWTDPDNTTLSVFITLTRNAQLNYREQVFLENTRFFVKEDGGVYPVEVGPGQDVQIQAYNQDVYNQLLPGFPYIPQPRPNEMVALVVQPVPQGLQVMKVFFSDGTFFNLANTVSATPEPSPVPEPPAEADDEGDDDESTSLESEYSSEMISYQTAMKSQSLRYGVNMNEMMLDNNGNEMPRWVWDDGVNAWKDQVTNTWFVPGLATDNLPDGGWERSGRLNGEIVYSSSAESSTFASGEGMKFTLNSSNENPYITGLELSADQEIVDLMSSIVSDNVPFFRGKHLIINFTHLDNISDMRPPRPNPYDVSWSGNAMGSFQVFDDKVIINYATGRIEQSVGGGFPQGAGIYVIYDAVSHMVDNYPLGGNTDGMWDAIVENQERAMAIATPDRAS